MSDKSSVSPSWQQLVCHASSQQQDQIELVMEDAGALSITWQDAKDTPVLEPLRGETPLWNDLVMTALFEAEDNLTFLSKQLTNNKDDWQIQKFHIETVEDQDWERVWMKDYHPMQFGDNLWIYPSNYEIPQASKDQTIIKLDPGLAFGTGTHPTTALCLEWLDKNPPTDLNVIDYGCGSGILAVAAAKLGAKHIVATDIDPQGLLATKDNMLRNNIADIAISCFLPHEYHAANKKPEPVDLVIANILCGPLIKLYPILSSLTKTGGKIVLSGILSEQKDQLIETYTEDFSNFDIQIKDNWVRVSAVKVDKTASFN